MIFNNFIYNITGTLITGDFIVSTTHLLDIGISFPWVCIFMFFSICRQLFASLAEELEKREMPYDQSGHEDKGAEPVLVGRIDYDDETLPLKDEKKSS